MPPNRISLTSDLRGSFFISLSTDDQYRSVSEDISVRAMPISHGQNNTSGVYDSAAFFVRHDPSALEFLFFGDVEPDSLSPSPRTINVWRAAAAKVPLTLSTIFIECSWPSGRPDDSLFGHLSPTHLADELTALATEIVLFRNSSMKDVRIESRPTRKKSKSNPLSLESLYGALHGVRVFVIHCKDSSKTASNYPINHVITDQVRALVEAKRLGAEILAADQGMRIGTSLLPTGHRLTGAEFLSRNLTIRKIHVQLFSKLSLPLPILQCIFSRCSCIS